MSERFTLELWLSEPAFTLEPMSKLAAILENLASQARDGDLPVKLGDAIRDHKGRAIGFWRLSEGPRT